MERREESDAGWEGRRWNPTSQDLPLYPDLSIFLNVLLCMVCVHECVRACVSFYLCVSSRDETRATRLEGQVPLPFEPELPCLPFRHCHGYC